MMTGARPHAPRQRVSRKVKRPSLVVEPTLTSSSLGEAFEYVLGTLDVTGRAQANANDVFAARLKGELGIERRHAVDLGKRHVQPLGDADLHIPRHMLKDVLRRLQRDHNGALLPLVLLDDLVELRYLSRFSAICFMTSL